MSRRCTNKKRNITEVALKTDQLLKRIHNDDDDNNNNNNNNNKDILNSEFLD